jgi:hypothetical protein
MIYIIAAAFIVATALALRGHQSEMHGDPHGNAAWHRWEASQRILLFLAFITHWVMPYAWLDLALAAAGMSLFLPIAINIFALDESPFYIGKTSWVDKKIGHWQWAIYLVLFFSILYFRIR